ncbi:MAG: RsmB/NOP family class I SAM-dependent RNA methyltransferase [Candidatus Bathyarchaeota archaeon]|nr:RsmB/NOP family class I SAM-dependent RNA methyltransferase [Candidatus Bathyarchaeota archaeon]
MSERLALTKTIKQLQIENFDAARLANKLVYETTKKQNFIDAFINSVLAPRTLDEFDLGVQAFLRLFVYQTRIAKNWAKPDLEEAENTARLARLILSWKTMQQVEPFLGRLLTQNRTAAYMQTDDETRIALDTFHPTWFVKYCIKLFGRHETLTMLNVAQQQPPTYLRLNTLKAEEKETLDRLTREGVQIEKISQLRHAYKVLDTKQPLTSLQSIREGSAYVQDKASIFTVEAANPQPAMTILDICAAPGAKTTYLAQLMQNRGTIYSVDYSKRRMATWKREIAHMGVDIAEPLIADARQPLPLNVEADLVLVDPPCTSTGVFWKLPSAKWRLSSHSIERMADVQWQIINICAGNVKAGGTLVYSTCSITAEENEMIIERFLKWHVEFSLAEIAPNMGCTALRGLDKCRRLYPYIHQCNGAFIAKLQKQQDCNKPCSHV